MRFLSIEVDNFLSFEHAELNLENRGLVLVDGDNLDSNATNGNGSGKSALIVEAILWCLFGKTARGVTGDDVIRRSARINGAYVRVSWSANGKEYKVIRHQGSSNRLKFISSDREFTQTDKRRTQQLIEETLGFDMKVALYALVLGQDSLCFASATDAAKKEVFETVFRFDLIKAAHDKAKQQHSKLESNVNTLSHTIDSDKGNLQRKEESICQKMNEEDAWRIDQTKAIETLQQQARVMQQARVSAEQDEIELRISTAQLEQLSEVETEQRILIAEIPGIDDRARSLHREIGSLVDQVSRLESNAKKLDASDVCPTCNQPLPKKELQRLKQSAAEEHDEADRIHDAGEKLSARKDLLLDYKEVTNLVIEQLSGELTQKPFLQDRCTLLQRRVKQNNELEAELAALKVKIEQVERAECPLDALIEALKQEIEEIKGKITENSDKIVSLKQKMAYFTFWMVGFSKKGLQSYILDTILPYLTSKANEYAAILCDGDIELSFSTTRETKTAGQRDDFTIECVNRHGAAQYQGNSGGERDRINFAITLALQDMILHKLGIDLNYAVFDECVPYTDREGVERVVRLLKSLKRSTIFFVSHSPYYADYFPNRLTVTKQGGISRLETQ